MTGRHHHGAAPSFCFRESIKDLKDPKVLKDLKDLKDPKDLKVPKDLKPLNLPPSSPHPTPYYIYKGQGKETYLPPPSSLHPPQKSPSTLPFIAQTPCKCAKASAFLLK